MKTLSIFSASALAFGFISCATDQTGNDLIRRIELSKAALFCSTNEPFTTISFNQYGDGDGSAGLGNGTVYYKFPNNTPPDFFGEQSLKRTGGAYDADTKMTGFELSNGMIGHLEETPEGACEDDMAGTRHDYRITIENWGEGSTSNLIRSGCCSVRQPIALPE